MSNEKDLAAKQKVFAAMDPNEVSDPNLPVDVAVQEAEDLFYFAKDDLPALKAAGLNPQTHADLPPRAGASRQAQSIWNKERNMLDDAQTRW